MPRLTIEFDDATWAVLDQYAIATGATTAEVARDWTLRGIRKPLLLWQGFRLQSIMEDTPRVLPGWNRISDLLRLWPHDTRAFQAGEAQLIMCRRAERSEDRLRLKSGSLAR